MQKTVVLASDSLSPWYIKLQTLIDEGNFIVSVTSHIIRKIDVTYHKTDTVVVVYQEPQH